MNTGKKLGIGSALALLGALGILLGPFFGATELGRPWSFLAGFLAGVSAGLGAALAVSGLIDYRKQR